MSGTEDEIRVSLERNNAPKLSSADYEYWDKVKAATLVLMLDILRKEVEFYQKLEVRKQQFCRNWFGDIHKALSLLTHH